MKKILTIYSLLMSLNVSAYPAYIASECGWLSRKAITFEKLGPGSGDKLFATSLTLRRKYDFLPQRGMPQYYLTEVLHSHKGMVGPANPQCYRDSRNGYECYNITTKDQIETSYYGWYDPQDYWPGLDTHHYWRRVSLRHPGLGYNSVRALKNVTSCCIISNCDNDWDSLEFDEEQKPLFPIIR